MNPARRALANFPIGLVLLLSSAGIPVAGQSGTAAAGLPVDRQLEDPEQTVEDGVIMEVALDACNTEASDGQGADPVDSCFNQEALETEAPEDAPTWDDAYWGTESETPVTTPATATTQDSQEEVESDQFSYDQDSESRENDDYFDEDTYRYDYEYAPYGDDGEYGYEADYDELGDDDGTEFDDADERQDASQEGEQPDERFALDTAQWMSTLERLTSQLRGFNPGPRAVASSRSDRVAQYVSRAGRQIWDVAILTLDAARIEPDVTGADAVFGTDALDRLAVDQQRNEPGSDPSVDYSLGGQDRQLLRGVARALDTMGSTLHLLSDRIARAADEVPSAAALRPGDDGVKER